MVGSSQCSWYVGFLLSTAVLSRNEEMTNANLIAFADVRIDWLAALYKPKTIIPAFLTCVDIAGLTAGAASGAGLGNAFLSNVRAVDGIFQVVRKFVCFHFFLPPLHSVAGDHDAISRRAAYMLLSNSI